MINKDQELIDNMMMNYVTNPEECYPDYDLDEMFPDHEYGFIDIIN